MVFQSILRHGEQRRGAGSILFGVKTTARCVASEPGDLDRAQQLDDSKVTAPSSSRVWSVTRSPGARRRRVSPPTAPGRFTGYSQYHDV